MPQLDGDQRTRAKEINEFFSQRVPGLFGLTITTVSPSGAKGELIVTEPLIAGNGFVFAPVIAGMGDMLCASAIGFHLPPGAGFTTLELKTNFLSTAKLGERVVGEAVPVHIGRSTHVWDAIISNATTSRKMAVFRNTQMVFMPKDDSTK